MSTKVDTGAAIAPQASPDNSLLAQLPRNEPAVKPQPVPQRNGARSRAARAQPTQRTQPDRLPLAWRGPAPFPQPGGAKMILFPVIYPAAGPTKLTPTLYPAPLPEPPGIYNTIYRPVPFGPFVPMKSLLGDGTAPRFPDFRKPAFPSGLELELESPGLQRPPLLDAKGSGKPAPSSKVFTSVPQQQAFQSVVHLTDGSRGGSGVIVANKGDQYMMLTNEHCLKGKKVGDTVSFTLSDGTKLRGKVAALGDEKVNDSHDLAAIVFTSTKKLTTAKLAKTEPKVDQKMFAIGYPFEGKYTETTKPSDRVDQTTGAIVTEGKITANRRDGEGQIQGEYGLVTTSRVISGMSGGGMFDATTGEVVAINGQKAGPIIAPRVQDGISFEKTVGAEGESVGIAAAEIGQFLRQNKATVPDWAQG